ncbi:hypothetical protein C1J03_13645 [Sulfitobacter sp. SK012]|uniref:NfeD family protein n=1 Tax=Sulfitobacter sp. SK012 TaxID=1389005 RepID=UPI000E0BFD9E|nr:hypothetical protein [Sulfitobacter sp. SK012]AXI46969.1 hypothetical protein C1J03_13645 [Sulfitobacter sp. SK012]
MESFLTIWWVWLCISLGLGVIELLVPGTIFLGFALGALAVAVLVGVLSVTNVPALLAVFAGLSLIAWVVLRMVFRRQSSGARVVTHDINDN